MSSVVQVLSPQAEELQSKRREMADLRRRLADKELELSTATAALHGHARAQNRLAEIYEQGTGIPKSYKESLKWYGRAASQGDDLAQFNLARLLEASGASEEALLWFHKAGEQGNLLAQVVLGNRIGVDDDQTFKWFRLAAEQGHSEAQYHLGLMYRNGRGTPVDFQEAIRWLHRSAEQDHLPAIGALHKLEHSLKV